MAVACTTLKIRSTKPTSANYSWSLHELPSSLFDLVPAMRSSLRDGHLMEQRGHWFSLHVGESANTVTWFRDGLQNIRVGRLKIRCVVCNVKHQEEFRRLSSCVLPRPPLNPDRGTDDPAKRRAVGRSRHHMGSQELPLFQQPGPENVGSDSQAPAFGEESDAR